MATGNVVGHGAGRFSGANNILLEAIPSTFSAAIVIGTADATMSNSPVASIAAPILLESLCSPILAVGLQPLHQLHLQNICEGLARAGKTADQKLVPLLVLVERIEKIDMLSLLPCNAGEVCSTYEDTLG